MLGNISNTLFHLGSCICVDVFWCKSGFIIIDIISFMMLYVLDCVSNTVCFDAASQSAHSNSRNVSLAAWLQDQQLGCEFGECS